MMLATMPSAVTVTWTGGSRAITVPGDRVRTNAACWPAWSSTTAPLARMNMLDPDHRARVTDTTAPPRNMALMAFGARPRASRSRASSSGTDDATARATTTDVWWDTTR